MGAMSPTHWLIVIGVLVLLFGAKKLPDLARSVGQSTRVLRGEMRGLREDEETPGTPTAAPTAVEPPAVPAPAATRTDAT
ncbi:Sec-independent protein translocase subunit TatA [Pseudonocardia endophytica]|uniref:Sec-independent protein translocase protein TatA n=1 Tax=Pseudonocardia endophytica TaxID=401976 RepID=A0A4R1HHW8_PSEEN|nr:Sec-independent protein translocase subunit TatA [Pseudonocardia endophytica]TCK20035.1 sec-independent protein translocase protein TatA [Pseudonocardia endophytica]